MTLRDRWLIGVLIAALLTHAVMNRFTVHYLGNALMRVDHWTGVVEFASGDVSDASWLVVPQQTKPLDK